MNLRQLFSFGFLAALLPACGGSDDEGPSGAALPDPCALITPAEIESLLGAPVAGEAINQNSLSRCTWEVKSTTVIRSDELVLSIAPGAAYRGDESFVGGVDYAIGDEGQLLDQNRGVQIAWKKGSFSADYRYSISGAFTEDFEPRRTRAKELAQASAGRM